MTLAQETGRGQRAAQLARWASSAPRARAIERAAEERRGELTTARGTGIRFRPYVLWLRLERAIASYAAGTNLTEASCAGGFADSAQLSRTFKRMFVVLAGGINVQRA